MNLRDLLREGVISDVDYHFALHMMELDGRGDEHVGLAAALCSQWRERGHIRLDLKELCEQRPSDATASSPGLSEAAGRAAAESSPGLSESDNLPLTPETRNLTPQTLPLTPLLTALRASPVVGAPGAFRPLILDEEGGLYLQRYWRYEETVAEQLLARTGFASDAMTPEQTALLDALFPESEDEAQDQRAAAQLALRGRLTVISGGPGTGKTTTVVRILALLCSGANPVSVALAAPTGKAAARMQDAIRAARPGLPVRDEVRQRIPDAAVTLHRLLGARPGLASCRYTEGRPLPHDVVIVDEASMIDVALMAKLLNAMRPEARLILLGDKDQLASVEAGALLGDVCWGAEGVGCQVSGVSPACDGGGGSQGAEIQRPTSNIQHRTPNGPSAPLRRSAFDVRSSAFSEKSPPPASLLNHIVLLRKNYRFAAGSGIGALAEAIKSGDAGHVLAVLRDGPDGVTWHEALDPGSLEQIVRTRCVAAFGGAEEAQDLAVLERFRVLCALRRGPYGAASLNRAAAEALGAPREGPWYAGRPVIVTRNDYHARLYNGDTGIAVAYPDGLRIVFPTAEGGLRAVHPGRLPEHETAYAMTIHRAQGSEFDEAIVVLPDVDSPVMSRELLYTAVTRARSRIDLWATPEIVRLAVERPIRRKTGLRRKLWGGAE